MDQAAAHTPARPRFQNVKAYGTCFLIGLLIGLLPVGVRLVQTQGERDSLQQQLSVAQLEMHLATAALMARHGDFTAARDAAIRFYAEAKRAADAPDDALSTAQVTYLQKVLTEREALISLLSRGDPAGAERSTAMYVAHRAAFPPK